MTETHCLFSCCSGWHQIKHGSLWGESTVNNGFPSQRAQWYRKRFHIITSSFGENAALLAWRTFRAKLIRLVTDGNMQVNDIMSPFYSQGLTLIPAWICNYIKLRIHYPKVSKWISRFIPHFTRANDYLSMFGLKLIHVGKRAPGSVWVVHITNIL